MDLLDLARNHLPEWLKVPLRQLRFSWSQRGFEPYVVERDYEGTRFRFLVGDAIGRRWYDGPNSTRLTREMAFMRDRMIEPGDVILDCGAHHGLHTVAMALWAGPGGRVVAFEPAAENFAILERNVRLNGLQNVKLQRKALGSATGAARLTRESNARLTRASWLGTPVEVTTLDSYAADSATLLKLDVEGHEIEALRGAGNVLARRPKLAIEVHTETLASIGASPADVFALLAVDDYDWWLQATAGEEPRPFSPTERISSRVNVFGLPRSRP